MKPEDLESNHIVWLFEAAAQHFAEKIREMELENLLYASNPTAPVYSHHAVVSKETRESMIKRNTRYIEQYAAILEFCQRAKATASQKAAEQFAKDFVGYLKRKESKRE